MGAPQKHIISIGMKHGHLTVIADAGYDEHRCRLFECRCDCGEVVVLRATHLHKTRRYCTRTCQLLRDMRVVDLSNKRFGRWLVKSRSGSDNRGDATWMCVCDCGTERVVRGFQLTDGNSQSCGCAGPEKKTLYFTPEAKLEAARRRGRMCNRKNPARVKANKIKYENKLSKATPKWLTKEHWDAMNAMYQEAKRLTRETGLRHEVDHIHPINGKTLSGLHVPWNLQILTQSANVAKSNRYADHSGD